MIKKNEEVDELYQWETSIYNQMKLNNLLYDKEAINKQIGQKNSSYEKDEGMPNEMDSEL